MNLKLRMRAEVSLVDRTDWLGAVTAVKTGKPCRHRELVGAHRMNTSTIMTTPRTIIRVQLGINQYSNV